MSEHKLTEAELAAHAWEMTGTDIVTKWVAEVGTNLARAQDADLHYVGERTLAWCPLYMDMDYRQAWLLLVRHNDGRQSIEGPCVVDHLAVLDDPSGFVCEWRGQPHHVFDEDYYGVDVKHWFVDWVAATIGKRSAERR